MRTSFGRLGVEEWQTPDDDFDPSDDPLVEEPFDEAPLDDEPVVEDDVTLCE